MKFHGFLNNYITFKKLENLHVKSEKQFIWISKYFEFKVIVCFKTDLREISKFKVFIQKKVTTLKCQVYLELVKNAKYIWKYLLN